MTSAYDRLGTIPVEEILPLIPLSNKENLPYKKEYFGTLIRMNSHRYKVYKTKGVICTQCGLEGKYFAVEKSISQETKKYHLNLYAVKEDGTEVMMTVDHIIPKALNGADTLDNKQPMCQPCNNKKGKNI